MEPLKVAKLADLHHSLRPFTATAFSHFPSTSSSSPPPPPPGSNPHRVLPLRRFPTVIIGILSLPNHTAPSSFPCSCFQFSDDSASVCCDLLQFQPYALGKRIRVTAWNFVPFKRHGKSRAGFLEIIKWCFLDPNEEANQMDSIPLVPNRSGGSYGNNSKARYRVYGVVESVGPVSIVPCTMVASVSDSDLNSSSKVKMLGFVVQLMCCECRLCRSKELISDLESGSGHSFTKKETVYFCGGASPWHPAMTKLIGNRVMVSRLKKKLAFITKEDSWVMHGMVDLMIESTQPLLTKWDKAIEAKLGGDDDGNGTVEVEVNEDLRSLAADVISRVCFGHSYSKGIEVFSKLRLMQKKMSKHGAFLFGIKGLRDNLNNLWRGKENEIKIMEREVESLIWELVEERKQECSEKPSSKKDLMQLLLEAAMSDDDSTSLPKDFAKQFIVDNCKNIYFAGHETVAITASWSLMLLAAYPEWQDRVRKEVAQVFSNGIPNVDSLPLLKTLTMVIHEVLRLYPPGAFVSREVYKDIQIGKLSVPKGVVLWTLIPTIHRDPEIWGANANEFQPERFKDGVSKACKYPQAYVPFGVGPRLCVGKNFAMVQLKLVLALIVSRFRFSLSPSYKHAPAYRMIIEPGHGVHLLIHKV